MTQRKTSRLLSVSCLIFIVLAERVVSSAVASEVIVEEKTYPIVVDCTKTFDEMVVAGHYDFVNERFTKENFPILGSDGYCLPGVKREDNPTKEIAVLVDVGLHMQREDILKNLDRLGLRAGNVAELLALGEQYPEAQSNFSILELSTIWTYAFTDGKNSFTSLEVGALDSPLTSVDEKDGRFSWRSWKKGRGITLEFAYGACDGCRFLAFRKPVTR